MQENLGISHGFFIGLVLGFKPGQTMSGLMFFVFKCNGYIFL